MDNTIYMFCQEISPVLNNGAKRCVNNRPLPALFVQWIIDLYGYDVADAIWSLSDEKHVTCNQSPRAIFQLFQRKHGVLHAGLNYTIY